MNVNRLSPAGWLRLVPPKGFLVASLLLSVLLALSISSAYGHAQPVASDSNLNEPTGLLGSLSETVRDRSNASGPTASSPAPNSQESLVIDEDFELGNPPGFALKNGSLIACEQQNCFLKQVSFAEQSLSPRMEFGQNSWQDY